MSATYREMKRPILCHWAWNVILWPLPPIGYGVPRSGNGPPMHRLQLSTQHIPRKRHSFVFNQTGPSLRAPPRRVTRQLAALTFGGPQAFSPPFNPGWISRYLKRRSDVDEEKY